MEYLQYRWRPWSTNCSLAIQFCIEVPCEGAEKGINIFKASEALDVGSIAIGIREGRALRKVSSIGALATLLLTERRLVLGSSGRGEKLSIIGNNRQQLNPSIEAGVCVYGSEKGTTGNLAQPLRVRVGPHFQAALSACHEDYALNADLTLERVEFGAAITFGAFSSSNSRTSASTSSCKRTKLSPRGDRLRCASRIIPKSTFRNGGTRERTASSPARTSEITVFSGNRPTASVSATIIFIIATDSQAIAGNDFAMA